MEQAGLDGSTLIQSSRALHLYLSKERGCLPHGLHGDWLEDVHPIIRGHTEAPARRRRGGIEMHGQRSAQEGGGESPRARKAATEPQVGLLGILAKGDPKDILEDCHHNNEVPEGPTQGRKRSGKSQARSPCSLSPHFALRAEGSYLKSGNRILPQRDRWCLQV